MGKTVNIDAVVATAVEAWDGATGSATVAKVLALRPLVRVAPNAKTRRLFASKVNGDKSSVGRFWQAAEEFDAVCVDSDADFERGTRWCSGEVETQRHAECVEHSFCT